MPIRRTHTGARGCLPARKSIVPPAAMATLASSRCAWPWSQISCFGGPKADDDQVGANGVDPLEYAFVFQWITFKTKRRAVGPADFDESALGDDVVRSCLGDAGRGSQQENT